MRRDHPREQVLLRHDQQAEEQRKQDMLCLNVRASTSPSRPVMPVTEVPVDMFCGEIILPITPPDEFVAAISTGSSPSLFAATTCRLPNNALADVSLPVRNTADQPRNEATSGNRKPREATPRPSV